MVKNGRVFGRVFGRPVLGVVWGPLDPPVCGQKLPPEVGHKLGFKFLDAFWLSFWGCLLGRSNLIYT